MVISVTLRCIKNFFCRRTTEKITAFAAIAAVILAGYALSIASSQLVSDNRAWIAPGGIQFERGSPSADNWIIGLKYQNTGNQPALEFNFDIKTFPIPAGELHNIPVLKRTIIRALHNKECREFQGKGNNSAIFPNAMGTLVMDVKPSDKEKYIKTTHFLVVAGYITYVTFTGTRHSCFCRFLDFTADRKNPKNWRSSVCRVPEYAD